MSLRDCILLACLAAFSGTSCSPRDAASPKPSARAVEAAAPPERFGATKSSSTDAAQAALEDKLEVALAYVAELRGLRQKKVVGGRIMSRQQIGHYLEQQITEQAPKDVVEAAEALLFGLGTVPADFDYRASLLALMSSQLLGFYDPKQKIFFVGEDLSGAEADATLWHELVHALQDQHYDLERLTEWQPDRGDSQAALHGLAEGDATSVMLDAILKPRGTDALSLPDGVFRAESLLGAATLSAPPVLVRSLLAPYMDGLTFTHFLRRRSGFPAVDAAWRAPPISTEQLLHPEKYLAGEKPSLVPLPSGPAHASDLKERYHDVIGEQTLRIVFEEWMPARTAASSAGDWDGDRLAAFSDEARERWALAWHLRYDTEVAAETALLAFARGALHPGVSGNGTPDVRYISEVEAKKHMLHGSVCQESLRRGPFAAIRRGKDLAVTIGPFNRATAGASPGKGCSGALAWANAVLSN